MKRSVSYTIILSLFILSQFFPTACGMVIGDAIITGDTVWTNTDIIEIVDSVVVTSTGHLTIEPGAIILFDLMSKMNIYGQLAATGDETNRIVFTTVADTINGSPGSSNIWYGMGAWEGGRLMMSYCDVRYALTAVSLSRSEGDFDNCVIENFMGHGFLIDGIDADPQIDVSINGCRIIQSNPSMKKTGTGIYALRSVNLSVAHSEISDCRLGINIYSFNTSSPHYSFVRSEISRHYADGIYILGSG
ncbi:MAG: right-handed parallel beta-helix repeat-containing protein [Candidatus Zixiibacteriota bacterium]